MASVNEIVEGLQILANYTRRGDESQISGADHDIICGFDVEVSMMDKERLETLGWHYDSEYECWSRFV